jgi:hypothetical protein
MWSVYGFDVKIGWWTWLGDFVSGSEAREYVSEVRANYPKTRVFFDGNDYAGEWVWKRCAE